MSSATFPGSLHSIIAPICTKMLLPLYRGWPSRPPTPTFHEILSFSQHSSPRCWLSFSSTNPYSCRTHCILCVTAFSTSSRSSFPILKSRSLHNLNRQCFRPPYIRNFRSANMRNLPLPLRGKSRSRLLCFACNSPNHLWDCSKRAKYQTQLQAYTRLGAAATCLLGHDTHELSDSDHSVMQVFEESKTSPMGPCSPFDTDATNDDDTLFDTLLGYLMETYDSCTSYTSTIPSLYLSNPSSAHLTPFLVPESVQSFQHHALFSFQHQAYTWRLLSTGHWCP